MENEIALMKVLDIPDELKDAANIYKNCINLNGIKLLKSPSLKYGQKRKIENGNRKIKRKIKKL